MNNDLISRSDIKDHIGELLLVYSGEELANAILNAIDNAPAVESYGERTQSMKFTVIDKKTNKEADTYTIALKEDWAKSLIYCDIEGFAITEDGTLVLMDECGNVAYCPDDRFEVLFDNDESVDDIGKESTL